MTSKRNEKPHAIMVCFHLQGHIIPFVNLAIKLASKGFSITFAHLDSVHRRISNSQHKIAAEGDVFARARSSGLDIRYTTFDDGFPLAYDRTFNPEYMEFLLHGFTDKVDKLVGDIIHSDSSTAPCNYFLITDTFCVWHEKIAKKYGLVNVSFWTEPAIIFSLSYHLELLREKGHVPVNGRREIVDYIPGVKSINTRDFVSFFHEPQPQLVQDLIFGAFDIVKSADFILCNTVEELEAETITVLQQKQPFYAVGPLFPTDFSIAKTLLPEASTGDWLDSRSPGSVLYVSFGSQAKTDRNVILEIAGGLFLSEVSFIWVIRPGSVGSDDGGVLWEGFEDGTRDRGLVVPWCRQNEVLQNPAVAGFLTHCGWNSILESVWCGVPMICYPLIADQITNRSLVVDDWRAGINLCDGECVRKEEVAEKIKVLMGGKKSKELTQQIQKVRTILRSAVTEGGSSDNNLDRFIEDVSNEVMRRSQ